jgi:hypothetical protein
VRHRSRGSYGIDAPAVPFGFAAGGVLMIVIAEAARTSVDRGFVWPA